MRRLLKLVTISEEEATVFLRVLKGTTLCWSEGALRLTNVATLKPAQITNWKPSSYTCAFMVYTKLPPNTMYESQFHHNSLHHPLECFQVPHHSRDFNLADTNSHGINLPLPVFHECPWFDDTDRWWAQSARVHLFLMVGMHHQECFKGVLFDELDIGI